MCVSEWVGWGGGGTGSDVCVLCVCGGGESRVCLAWIGDHEHPIGFARGNMPHLTGDVLCCLT